MRPRLIVTRSLRLTIPRANIDGPLRVGYTFRYVFPQEFNLSIGMAFQPPAIRNRVQIMTIMKLDKHTAEVVARFETRTYVRHRP